MAETDFHVFRGRQRGFQFGFQAGDERLIHHVVDDFARRVKRAGLFAGGRAGFRVVGREQIFKHLAGQFGVERDFFLDGRVFRDGELVVVQRVDEAAHFDLLEFSCRRIPRSNPRRVPRRRKENPARWAGCRSRREKPSMRMSLGAWRFRPGLCRGTRTSRRSGTECF
jgi:hypothetical protein